MTTNSTRVYFYCSLFLLAFLFLISILNFSLLYPHFSDVYYHMSVIRAFSDAGGLVLTDFWSFAPSGRPHIYMPFIHTVGYLLNASTGISPWTFITMMSWLLVPLSFLLTWFLVRDYDGDASALIALSVLAGSGAWFFNQAAHTANAAALCLGIGALIAFKRDRFILTFVLCLFACLSHGSGFTALITITVVSLCHPERFFKRALPIAAMVVTGTIPWILHLFNHSRAIQPLGGIFQLHRFHLAIILLFFAAAGFIIMIGRGICHLRKKERKQAENTLIFPVFLLSFAIFFPMHFAHRFWGFNSYLPYACLAGCGSVWLIQSLNRTISNRIPSEVFVVILVFIHLTFYPTWNYDFRSINSVQYRDTAIQRMLHPDPQTAEMRKLAIFLDKNKNRFSTESIVYSTGAKASLVTSITGARTSGGMLAEVIPANRPASMKESDFVLRVIPHPSKGINGSLNDPPHALIQPNARTGKIPSPRGFRSIDFKDGIHLFENTIQPETNLCEIPDPAVGLVLLLTAFVGFLILVLSDIIRFHGYRTAAAAGFILIFPAWIALFLNVSDEEVSKKPLWKSPPSTKRVISTSTTAKRTQKNTDRLYTNLPPTINRRWQALKQILRNHHAAGINVDYYWPVERQKRLESILRQRDYNRARELILMGLRDSARKKIQGRSGK